MSKQTNPPKSAGLTAQLRWYLSHADETTHAISLETGVDHSALYRFLAGTRGLSHSAQDRLTKHLKLRLVRDEN